MIVITFNDAGRLPRAVRSVLRQSLRDLEVVVVDDCSTDDTPLVVRGLQDEDRRVRYVRLARNSGGCGAPRNAGIDEARSPCVMFLDSDDELPRHAAKSLLLTVEQTGADFVTGEVSRLWEKSGKRGLWYPELFDDVRVVDGVRRDPRYFFDHLSTNKLYRVDFLFRHGLRFPEDIHYEDQLFSAQAFTLARSFAVVPWVVYTWHLAADPVELSISSSRHKLRNVEDRIAVARMIDGFLDRSDNADLRPAKDEKFLRHDLRLYLGDLPFRDLAWTERFAEVVTPYLRGLSDAAVAAVPREQRVCQYLLCEGRLGEAVECARTLGRPWLAPRHVHLAAGRTVWGRPTPVTEPALGRGPAPVVDPASAGVRVAGSGAAAEASAELDVSEWRLWEQPFRTSPVRHEVDRVSARGPVLRLSLRTYDPARLLTRHDGVTAQLWLAAAGEPLKIPLVFVADVGGTADVYTAEVELDLRCVPMTVKGFAGCRHPQVVLWWKGDRRSDPVLAPGGLAELQVDVKLRAVPAGHTVRVGCEGGGLGRLQLLWRRSGGLGVAQGVAGRVLPARRAMRRVWRRATGPRAKVLAYHELTRLPVDRRLVLFEAQEGRGYADSPRYIHEELVRRGSPLKTVWSFSGDSSSFPDGVRLVRRGSWEYVRVLARAGYWVDSHGLPSVYAKRPETRYLQTWHGQALKHMGFDAPELRYAGPERQRQHRDMVARWDALISPSAEFTRTFVRANGFAGQLLNCGLPRNDVLVRWAEPAQRERAAAARSRLQIPDGRRMLLYAPTFRDGQRGTGRSVRVDLEELVRRCGDEWVVVVRPHYYERFLVPREFGHAVRDGRRFTDVNDLLLASDALLTDYSSVMFDYVLLGRPVLLFTDDWEEYRASARGTYYDLAEIAPGPMLATTGELADALKEIDLVQQRWTDRYTRFRAMFNPDESGQACKTVVDCFFEGGAQ